MYLVLVLVVLVITSVLAMKSEAVKELIVDTSYEFGMLGTAIVVLFIVLFLSCALAGPLVVIIMNLIYKLKNK